MMNSKGSTTIRGGFAIPRGKRRREEEEREECVCACVCMRARRLRTSRLSETETGHGRRDADRDGHLWLQRHGWGVRNGHNERVEPVAREWKYGGKAALDSLQLFALAKAR